MLSISAPTALSVLTRGSTSPQIKIGEAVIWKERHLWLGSQKLAWYCKRLKWHFAIGSINSNSSGSSKNCLVPVEKNQAESNQRSFGSLKEMVHVLSPVVTSVRARFCSRFAIIVYVTFAIGIVIARKVMFKRQNHVNQGSIADLVKRGQLKSNRRGIAKTGLYDNPFNNAFVKIDEENSRAQIFGKVYHLAPATLTKEQQLTHQERRARAYQWKRPKVFLKEGDPLPPDVDPESVRWIPPNHPFACTSSDINEETFRNNVYQKNGVPFRVRAEHEALEKKLEALQDEPKMKELAINLKNPEKFEEQSLQQIEPDELEKENVGTNEVFESSNKKKSLCSESSNEKKS